MNKTINLSLIALLVVAIMPFYSCTETKKTAELPENVFELQNPDYKVSPLTGMTRQHWVDAAEYLLTGAFSYVNSMDDAMIFPKQFDKTYPNNDGQIPVAKLEGLCRTLFVAAPLLRERPDLVLNNIKVADYYRHQILQLINPESPSFIKRRTGGPSQTLVEFGALAISLSVIPDIIWEPFTQEQKDELAATMLSYGDGPTINSNWRFFNIFVLSFFKDQGYEVNEECLTENLEKALAFYRGEGWYNDSPAYDYYSMWAFQMYGPVWAQLYGNKYYPEYAQKFMANLRDLVDNYPYMFNSKGEMNMWGRSICYRFGSVAPLALTGYFNDPTNINYGWMRRIASSTMLQFLQNPDFLEDNVPTLGFYGPFEPAVQIYSCRGSVYWCGKAFLALLLPEDNVFWTAKENNGAWDNELKKGNVYNKFQPGTNLMITDYPNCGGAEMRSWCHESVARDWQKFRSTENYNKLAYHTEFPWMADGQNGEISMNYGVKNAEGKWEVLRLYTFKSFEDGMYRRDAVLETNTNIKFQLTDIPLADGVLRVDKVTSPVATDIRLGHYALSKLNKEIKESTQKVNNSNASVINNGEHQLALIPLAGWTGSEVIRPEGLHPVSNECAVSIATGNIENEAIYVTLMLWEKGNKKIAKLNTVDKVEIADNNKSVEITFKDKSKKVVTFE